MDATTIRRLARCLDWARQRRRKAAAQWHLRLDRQTFLPRFAIVGTAGEHDTVRARELCAGGRAGEIVIFDKASVDWGHLADPALRDVFWVPRAQDNLRGRGGRRFQRGRPGNLLRDAPIRLTGPARQPYPVELRRVVALVEVAGQLREMTFLTNTLDWSAPTIADPYRGRGPIERFCKQIEQPLQLAAFLGTSANAVRWQVWTALLTCVLLRFGAWLSQWAHSVTRRFLGTPPQAFLAGLG